MKTSFAAAIVFIVFTSCNGISEGSRLGLFEKTVTFSNHSWNVNNKLSFVFTITDTASPYNFFIVLRHSDAYQYNNIWVSLSAIAPGDTAQTQSLNLRLGDNTKGWLGSSMGDIIEQRILITHTPVKLKSGNYTFILQHIMREDELNNIFNAGIRIEKATP